MNENEEHETLEDQEFSPMSLLLNEVLEEIFVRISGNDQLNCRLVCGQWNYLLCNCSRLLQSSVQLSLELSDNEVNLSEHYLIPIIKANKALKVKHLTLDCDIFVGENSLQPDTVINFVKNNGINDMVETFRFSVSSEYNSADILHEFLSMLTRVNTLTVVTSHLDAEAEKYIKFDDRWQSSAFSSIHQVKLDNWSISDSQLWTPTYSNFLTNIIRCMPNIKIIHGIQGYNEDFYKTHAHVIEIESLNIHEIATKIVRTRNLKLKDLRLYGDSDYSAEEFWHQLNINHSELKSILFNYNSKGAPIPLTYDYTKVTELDLTHSFGDGSEEDLGRILTVFPFVEKLNFYGFVSKSCFFGHTPIELKHLKEAKILLAEEQEGQCKLTCNECVETYIKSLQNVEMFTVDVVSSHLLRSISINMTKLKSLSLSTSPSSSILSEWPEMPSLEHLIFLYGQTILIDNIQIIYKNCPILKSIQFSDSVTIKNEI